MTALNTALAGSNTHHIETVQPGKIYEVTPQRTNIYHGDIYLMRLTVLERGTRIEAFHPPFATWSMLDPIPAQCA